MPRRPRENLEDSRPGPRGYYVVFGGVLLSHALAGAVPSALAGLASGFGMGPGVSLPLSPPKLSETTRERVCLGVVSQNMQSGCAHA